MRAGQLRFHRHYAILPRKFCLTRFNPSLLSLSLLNSERMFENATRRLCWGDSWLTLSPGAILFFFFLLTWLKTLSTFFLFLVPSDRIRLIMLSLTASPPLKTYESKTFLSFPLFLLFSLFPLSLIKTCIMETVPLRMQQLGYSFGALSFALLWRMVLFDIPFLF